MTLRLAPGAAPARGACALPTPGDGVARRSEMSRRLPAHGPRTDPAAAMDPSIRSEVSAHA